MVDIRFPTALQMMLSLALAHEHRVPYLTSAQLAEGVRSNPSLARKLLVSLAQADLVHTAMGKSGGFRLSRPAGDISLKAVYLAVTNGKSLWIPRTDIAHRCLVSSNMEAFFEALTQNADEAVLLLLEQRTLAESLSKLHLMHNKTRRKTTKS